MVINALREEGYVPGISAEAYFAIYADKDGYVTLPDTKTFCEPIENVIFNDEIPFLCGRAYNCIKEDADCYRIYSTWNRQFKGMITLSDELFNKYFKWLKEEES